MKCFVTLIFANFVVLSFGVRAEGITAPVLVSKPLIAKGQPSHKLSCLHVGDVGRGSSIPGDIPFLKVLHGLDEPLITVSTRDSVGRHYDSWWTYNTTASRYNFAHLIRPPAAGSEVVAFEEIRRGSQHFYFVALSNTNQKHGETYPSDFLPIEPISSVDFALTNPAGKSSKGVVIYLKQKPNVALGTKLQLVAQQIVYGDDFGPILTFSVYTEPLVVVRECVLFTVLDRDELNGLVFCFPARTTKSLNDATSAPAPVKLFQKIPLNKSQLLRSVMVEGRTLVIVADCNYPRTKGYHHDIHSREHYDVLKIWSHGMGSGQFVMDSSIFFTESITSMDTIVTPGHSAFLTVAVEHHLVLPADSHAPFGVVYIYEYNSVGKKFQLHQTIADLKEVLQVRFQVVQNYKEVRLYILTYEAVNNILIYTFDSTSNMFVPKCTITSPGAKFLEPNTYLYNGHYRNQIISVNSSQANVIDF